MKENEAETTFSQKYRSILRSD